MTKRLNFRKQCKICIKLRFFTYNNISSEMNKNKKTF